LILASLRGVKERKKGESEKKKKRGRRERCSASPRPPIVDRGTRLHTKKKEEKLKKKKRGEGRGSALTIMSRWPRGQGSRGKKRKGKRVDLCVPVRTLKHLVGLGKGKGGKKGKKKLEKGKKKKKEESTI